MISLYLRTVTGDYFGTFENAEQWGQVWKENLIIPVMTAHGYPCSIPAQDVRTWGDKDTFVQMMDKIGGKSGKPPEDVRFQFVSKDGKEESVYMHFLDAEKNTLFSMGMSLEAFTDKFIKELPNAVSDAILSEKEERQFLR